MTTNDYDFETGIYRPPSEGGSASLLVRFTRNCPWNYCTFCAMYKTEKFQLRPLKEIKSDINAMAALAGDLKSESIRLGHNGQITREAILGLMDRSPALSYHQGVDMLIQWLLSGGKTAFIQDGNSLIMPPPRSDSGPDSFKNHLPLHKQDYHLCPGKNHCPKVPGKPESHQGSRTGPGPFGAGNRR